MISVIGDALLLEMQNLTWLLTLNPFTIKILLVILLTVCRKNSYDVSSENLVLDQVIIPSFIFF